MKTYAPTPEVSRPFVAPPCAHCGEQLVDAGGNPRWEIVGMLTFVCLGGCNQARSGRARKAALS